MAGIILNPPCSILSRGNGWWWVPVVAPPLGAAVGTLVYHLCLTFHHPTEDNEILAEQGSIVLVNTTAIDPDIKMLPKEKDAGETVPAGTPHHHAPAAQSPPKTLSHH